jgi:serine/threonine protein kinase
MPKLDLFKYWRERRSEANWGTFLRVQIAKQIGRNVKEKSSKMCGWLWGTDSTGKRLIWEGVVSEGDFYWQTLRHESVKKTRISPKRNSRAHKQRERDFGATFFTPIHNKFVQIIVPNTWTTTYSQIIELYYAFQDPHYVYLIMTYMEGGSLFDLMKTIKAPLPEDQAQFYAAQILLALEYLHHKNVIFRDLKPENVLLDEEG